MQIQSRKLHRSNPVQATTPSLSTNELNDLSPDPTRQQILSEMRDRLSVLKGLGADYRSDAFFSSGRSERSAPGRSTTRQALGNHRGEPFFFALVHRLRAFPGNFVYTS